MTDEIMPGSAVPAVAAGPTASAASAAGEQSGGWSATPAPADWRSAFPAEWGDRLKNMNSAEDAARALERGLAYTPALRPEDVELSYPEDVRVDEGVRDNFRRFCVEKGLTPTQAQALVDWQIAANREIAEAALAAGTADLRKRWGSRFEENSARALRAVTALDRGMGGRLSETLAASGMGNNPVLVEAFHAVGALLSEDVLSGGRAAPAEDRPETAEETYQNMFRR